MASLGFGGDLHSQDLVRVAAGCAFLRLKVVAFQQ